MRATHGRPGHPVGLDRSLLSARHPEQLAGPAERSAVGLRSRRAGTHEVMPHDRCTPESAQVGYPLDRKSTRLNSSHLGISYAVFCLKKKNTITNPSSLTNATSCTGTILCTDTYPATTGRTTRSRPL